MSQINFATELSRAEAAFRPVRVPPLADFSPEVSRAITGIDRAAFLEALNDFAAEPVSASGLSGLTVAGEHICQGVDFVPLHIDGTDDEINWWAVCALEFSPEFRNHFAMAWLNELCARLAFVESEDVDPDAPRRCVPEEYDDETVGQFWSPETRA